MYDLEGNALRFLPLILPKASKVLELAQLLRDHALQLRSSEVEALHEERLEMASASLQYIKDCGIRIEEHSHIADYTICLVCSDLSRQQTAF
ncbi:hypothetical protein BDZ97DRAFT_1850605 [Flammula alnicola]|nr:hypothetical protein BDZ97DRAFT_1850605 [Flammula alnicola]